MLLTNWAREQGLPAAGRIDKGQLEQILRFCFGENYVVQLKDGRSYEDKKLEAILDIMADEFRVHNTTLVLRGNTNMTKDGLYPKIELVSLGAPSKSDRLGQRGALSLCVSVVQGWANPLPPPGIEAVVEMVKHAVTMFSLTGEWASFQKENLT